MKSVLRLIIFTLSVAFIFANTSIVLAESEGVLLDEGVMDDQPDFIVYDTMVDQFEEERYEDAYANAKELERRNQLNYSKDGNRSVGVYLTYLEGWKAAKEDDIGTALECFEPFVENGFAKSKGYYNYLLGRVEQNNGNYEDALNYYEAALDPECYVDFALPYWRECKRLSNEQAYEEAQEYFNQGNYAAAAEKYAALNNYSDSNELMKESYYLLGKQKYEKREYSEAYNIFSMLAKYKYKDSKDLSDTIWQLSQNQDEDAGTGSLQCISSDTTSLELAWDDVQKLNDFVVAYYPLTMSDKVKTISVKQNTVTISNLIPGTKYCFAITSKQSDAVNISGEFETQSIVDTVSLYNDTTYVYSFRLRDQSGSGSDKTYDNPERLKGNVLQVQNRRLHDIGLGCMITPIVKNSTFAEDQDSFDIICTFRVGNSYVSMLQINQAIKTGYSTTTCFIDLTNSLDEIFDFFGEWPVNGISIDIVIDGMRADQVFIDVENAE